MASSLWQLSAAVLLVGRRLFQAAVSPSRDIAGGILVLMIIQHLWHSVVRFIFVRNHESKIRYARPPPIATRRPVAAMGVLGTALLGMRLVDTDADVQSTRLIILIAWFLFVLRLDAVLCQADTNSHCGPALEGTLTTTLFASLIVLDSFYDPEPMAGVVYTVFALASSTAALVVLVSIAKGPDEFFQGRPIDREHTCSLFELLTLSWGRRTFNHEGLSKIRLENLPTLRPDLQLKSFPTTVSRVQSRVSRALAVKHAPAFCLQVLLAILDAVLILGPDFITYKLLNWLAVDQRRTIVHGLVLATLLGASKIASVTVGCWLKWVTASRVLVPIQSSLNMLVYEKAMRLPSATSSIDGNSLLEMRNCCPLACAFYTDVHEIIVVLTKLLTLAGLLLRLLGWQSLIAGIAVTAISMPLSTIIAKRYSKTLATTTQLHEEQSTLLSQALLCIRQIKISAGEKLWTTRLSTLRNKELQNISSSAIWMSLLVFVSDISPIVLAGVPIYVFTMLGNPLSPSVAFTSISLFKEMQTAMSTLPMILPYIWNYWESLQRVERYLDMPEVGQEVTPAEHVTFTNATVSWVPLGQDEEQFSLQDISVEFPNGELSVITGKAGAGKTLLLAAIAGEAELCSGQISRPLPQHEAEGETKGEENWLRCGHVAFVTQNAWMSNDTILENILFGLGFQAARYASVIHACALEKDLRAFPDGDRTIVGIKGVSLSGGQRWRIALARAFYSRATLLLLDDVLSAVDTEVRQWIVDKALCGELATGRTRILATHHEQQALDHAACHIQLLNGKANVKLRSQKPDDSVKATPAAIDDATGAAALAAAQDTNAERNMSHEPSATPVPPNNERPKTRKNNVYRDYFNASGGFITWTIALSTILGSEGSALYASWWLKRWAAASAPLQSPQEYPISPATMYFALSCVACIVSAFRCYVWYLVGIKASRAFSLIMINHIFGANLQWLESTSHGDILAHFGDDMFEIDDRLPHALGFVIENAFAVAFIIISSTSFSIYEAPLIAGLTYLLISTGLRLISALRALQGIQDTAVSTIQQHVNALQAPDGIATVRSYGVTQQFLNHMRDMLDDRFVAYWNFHLCEAMIGFQFGALGALYITFSSVFIVLSGSTAGSAGIALTFASRLSDTISAGLNRMTAVESDFSRVQKIIDYHHVAQESSPASDISPTWPPEGGIRVENLTVGYGNSNPDTLSGVSFSINPGERIGVVGRTGAGKSSLTLAFVRLIEKRSGSIYIDDMDIDVVDVQTLRQRLLVIPQDLYFSPGTLRALLDPDLQYSDDKILKCLEKCQFFSTLPTDNEVTRADVLAMQISGDVLSPGQRQIISLVRAVLAQRKIIIMDEATSAVDIETDEAIQTALRTRSEQGLLQGATVIVVAHRLATVAQMDKVLVLADGRAVEFGPPKALYQRHGAFWALVSHSVDKEQLLMAEKKLQSWVEKIPLPKDGLQQAFDKLENNKARYRSCMTNYDEQFGS